MIKKTYGLLCDYASADISGKHNYMGVFQNINIDKNVNKEFLSPLFFVGIHLSSLESKKYELKLIVKSPDSKETEAGNGSIDLTASAEPEPTVALILPVGQVKLDNIGIWKIFLKVNGDDIFIVDFKVDHK